MVIQGRLVTEMIPENGILDTAGKRRVIRNEIGPYQVTPFYQGSMHTQFNPDCTNVTFVAVFSSEDSGTGQILDETFAFTNDIITASLGGAISSDNIDTIRQAIPKSIALGVDQCLIQCNLKGEPEISTSIS
jgi:hypothetical protein